MINNNEETNFEPKAITKTKSENPISITGAMAVKMKKSSFALKEQNSGNILTVHHTIKENNKMLRIVLNVCCFDMRGTQMLAIDRRGCIFVFNFTTKRYWRHNERVQKPSVAIASRKEYNQYVVGTKEGILVLLDVEISNFLKQSKISEEPIGEITFPGQPLEPKNLALIRSGHSALLIDLDTFNCSYRLDFDKVVMSLKFASFLSNSEHIMTAFTNDTLHIWSGVTLEVVRIVYPLKLRDKKLLTQEQTDVLEFSLATALEETASKESQCFPKYNKNLTDGCIAAYAFKNDGSSLILSTWDNFLITLSCYTFELIRLYRLKDFILVQLAILAKPNDAYVVGLTNHKMIVLLDCEQVEYKLIVDLGPSRYFTISLDSKYLAVSQVTGELSVWSLGHLLAVLKSQKNCMSLLRSAFKQKKPVKLLENVNDCQFQEELKKLLTPQRLQQILQEYHCYPAKYRALIWCSLLKLPHNRLQYQELLKMGVPSAVNQQAKSIQLKNNTLKRSLSKCWSCLAQWCKVLAHSEILPGLIFPFVKMFQQNPLTAFEVCCTLIQNHFQLFFEYHPLEPKNYLGLCTNLLQHFDQQLYEFYQAKDITATTFAWSLLKNAFSEVLDEDQWQQLWDNAISGPAYFLCFVVVSYSILQKELIIRLPDKNVIEIFFQEQNPIDVNRLISKAFKLLNKCPADLHPQKYFSDFQAIPPNVYPKFLKYPQKCLNKYEEKVEDLQSVNSALNARMRELELEELKLIQRLENGLRQEEHAKRMKDIEAYYQNTLKREEERLNCQRKMLLLYQKEIRQRKGEVAAVLQDSTKRKAILHKERELQSLQNHIENERMRNDLNLMWAEEELYNQDMELLSQKYLEQSVTQPLNSKYYDEIKTLCQEQELLDNELKMIYLSTPQTTSEINQSPSHQYLDDIEQKLDRIQNEFKMLTT
ncbi:TBC1 domain family member 31 [Lucilia cuprina]|uniref:TBC1 domain family member 31 n=1 Tax=Lucilia cuprina TaxID=7375 RepID=UPI001F07016E|nr:TBC1 domain family member 31 [Lucilia cuprina]